MKNSFNLMLLLAVSILGQSHLTAASAAGSSAGAGTETARREDAVIPQCSICLNEMTTQRRWTLLCGHSYCESCLSSWAEEHRTCPLCRNSILTLNPDIITAAIAGDVPALETLIARGDNVNAEDKYGNTALMHASINGHSSLIPPLIRSGALIDRQNQFGHTALMLAADEGHLESIRALIAAHATLDLFAIKYRRTALSLAIITNRPLVVQELITAGARFDQPDVQGITPLMHAMILRYQPIVALLRAAGARNTLYQYIRTLDYCASHFCFGPP